MSLADALSAHQNGNLEDAEKLYREFLKQEPYHADACALLGVIMGARGKMEQAVDLVDKAVSIDPSSGLLHFHRGTVLMAANKLPESLIAFERAVALQPHTPQIHFNFANALRSSKDWKGAIRHYEKALMLDPGFLAAMNNLALSLIHEKRYEDARQVALRSVEKDKDYGDGWLTLCNVSEKLKNYDEAINAGERATQLIPNNHYAWFGYGVALNRLDRDAEAVNAYKKALELNPERTDIWDNLAQTYQSLNMLEEAESIFHKTIEVAGQQIPGDGEREIEESEYGNRHWHLALMELMRGKYKEGFARYRARTAAIKELKRPKTSVPLWKGEDLRDKTLLVRDEQGFGDTLMLARFLPLLRARGANVTLMLHKHLKPLFDRSNCADTIISHEDITPKCDFFCSSFDLPHRLGVTLATIPKAVPYLPFLMPDKETTLPNNGLRRIGVVWGGSPLHKSDAKRSVPLELLADLFSLPNIDFYSFNRDMKEGDAERLPLLPIKDLAPLLSDFAVSAQLIGQMDLVISCDTATAHLAGGLGIKTWIMLPFSPDWRWMTERNDSPWYPTMLLFRQSRPGDWRSVVQKVKETLLNDTTQT